MAKWPQLVTAASGLTSRVHCRIADTSDLQQERVSGLAHGVTMLPAVDEVLSQKHTDQDSDGAE